MYRRFRPCPRLAPYVESYWIQEHLEPTRGDRPTRVLPVGKTDLLFHYGDRFFELREEDEALLPRSMIAGQRTRPVEVRASGKTGILLVGFLPWGATALLPTPMRGLTDRATNLEEVMKVSTVRRLEEQLGEAGTAAERVRRVEAFLLEALDDSGPDGVVVVSVHRLRAFHSCRNLPAEVGLSRRQWIRRFEESVGMSPKRFGRIMRFQRAAARKRAGWDWGEIAVDCGYYDQSHLIKEFQEFAGCAPGSFRPRETGLTRQFNRPSAFFSTVYL